MHLPVHITINFPGKFKLTFFVIHVVHRDRVCGRRAESRLKCENKLGYIFTIVNVHLKFYINIEKWHMRLICHKIKKYFFLTCFGNKEWGNKFRFSRKYSRIFEILIWLDIGYTSVTSTADVLGKSVVNIPDPDKKNNKL